MHQAKASATSVKGRVSKRCFSNFFWESKSTSLILLDKFFRVPSSVSVDFKNFIPYLFLLMFLSPTNIIYLFTCISDEVKHLKSWYVLINLYIYLRDINHLYIYLGTSIFGMKNKVSASSVIPSFYKFRSVVHGTPSR